MYLLVGLGNPGTQYQDNRHNIGFMAIDAIADLYNAPAARAKYHGLISEVTINGHKTLLLKPQTYMNNSGVSVAEVANFYKIPGDKIFVFYDELDLAHGKMRAKVGGGAAGHNGIRSIDAHFGNHFWRLRMGIGHPGDKARVHGYVLGNFTAEEREWLAPLVKACAKNLPALLENKPDIYMSKIAMDMTPFFKDKKQTDKKEATE